MPVAKKAYAEGRAEYHEDFPGNTGICRAGYNNLFETGIGYVYVLYVMQDDVRSHSVQKRLG